MASGHASRARPSSAPRLGAWRLPADQSYLGRAEDPEIVARVRNSLDQYQGPRSAGEQAKIIADKAAEGKKEVKGISAEYWAWAHKLKHEAGTFHLPEDPRKGMPSQESRIKANVEKGLSELRKQTSEHKAWLETIEENLAAKQLEKIEAKNAADRAFNSGAEARQEAIKQRYAGMQQQKKKEESQYWRWLHAKKDEVKKRPSSAPPARASGADSAAAMAQKKIQEKKTVDRAISSEYHSWLRSVSVASFHVPIAEIDYERRARQAAVAEERTKVMRKQTADYQEEVKEMERKAQERIMARVKEKLEADKRYTQDHKDVAQTLAVQMSKRKEKEKAVRAQSRRELQEMYKRVKEKPLFLEVAYKK